MTGTRESELAALRKVAEDMAKGRGERVTTGHLLAAIASNAGGAAELLKERRLDAEVLLKAARVLTDDHADAVSRADPARARARGALARRATPAGMHLLFALCQERTTAAYRAIAQCGSDVTKLRTAAMQLAMGIVGPRRIPAADAALAAADGHEGARAADAQRRRPPPRTAAARPRAGVACSAVAARASAPRGPTDAQAPARSGAQPATARPHGALRARSRSGSRRSRRSARNLTARRRARRARPGASGARRRSTARSTSSPSATRNCPCLVGPAGVGKTSVVRGLAQRIADGRDGRRRSTTASSSRSTPPALLAGTGVRGALAERIAQIKAEVARSEGRVVLFFDELHAVLTGDDEVAARAQGGARPRGARLHRRDHGRGLQARRPRRRRALARRMTAIEVAELAPDEALLALERVAPAFEKHHGVRFAPEAIAAAVAWSARYMPERALPDKAVSVLDLAGARARRRGETRGRARAGRRGRERDRAASRWSACSRPTARACSASSSCMAARVVGHARGARAHRARPAAQRQRLPVAAAHRVVPPARPDGRRQDRDGQGHRGVPLSLAARDDAPRLLRVRRGARHRAPRRRAAGVRRPRGGRAAHRGGAQAPVPGALARRDREGAPRRARGVPPGLRRGPHDRRARAAPSTSRTSVIVDDVEPRRRRVPARRRAGASASASARRASANATRAYEEALCAAARAALPPELYNRIDEVLAFAPLGRADVAEVARRMLRALGEELEAARGVAARRERRRRGGAARRAAASTPSSARGPMRRAIGRLVEAPIAEMILEASSHRGRRRAGRRRGRPRRRRRRAAPARSVRATA